MTYRISAGQRSGIVSAPSSKSMVHRLLIAAALSAGKKTLVINGLSQDVMATINCLSALGSDIEETENGGIVVTPIKPELGGECVLNCGESGTTLRLLLSVVGALGINASFQMEDSLAKRPVEELVNELTAHGVRITRKNNSIMSQGRLLPGDYSIPGNISSQYISGLLFALPLLNGESTLEITGKIESRDYILMTESVLRQTGIYFEKKDNRYMIPGCQRYNLENNLEAEADWSNAAFFLCMGAQSEKGITVSGLTPDSVQGDREILNILKTFGAITEEGTNVITVRRGKLKGMEIDASAIPDLVPTISALAACAEGTTRIMNAERLRYKESDRIETTVSMLSALGADAKETDDGIIIYGKPYLNGGNVNANNDHRIAMAAAVAACSCRNDVTVAGAECTAKSYPEFWKHLESLEVIR